MLRHLLAVVLVSAAFTLGCARHPAAVRPKATWRPVPVAGVTTTLDALDAGQGGEQALRLKFAKAGAERRFIAIEGRPCGDPAGAKALSVMYRLTLDNGSAPKLAFLLFEKDGGAWLRVAGAPLVADASLEARLPLEGLSRAEFAQDADAEPHPDQAARFQVGMVVDGPAEGTLELGRIAFTSESYRPTGPLPVAYSSPALWTIGKDPAAEARLTVTSDGPGGKPAVRLDFAFPGGRHMYVTPALSVQDVEAEGYRGFRFAYRASLPAGIGGLLVCASERGDHAQYVAEPPPPASNEWVTAQIAFDHLRLGGWSRDDNGRLDLGEIAQLIIGLHGTASEPKASGWIVVSEIELVP